MRPPHEVLCVPPGASQEDIKRAYMRRSGECHPGHGKEREWQELKEAYRVLTGKLPPHEILGVPPGASQEDIKRAYKRRSRECHPDHVKGKEKDWHELQEAYRVLTGKDSAKAAVPPQGAGWVVVDVAEVEALAHKTIEMAEQMATSKIQGITGGGWFGDLLKRVAVGVVSQSGADARRKLSERLHERTGEKG